MTVLLVLLGGAVGAPLRYLTDQLVSGRASGAFPWGTFTVNVAGSFLLGALASAAATTGAPGWVLDLAGTGFCGALTTFSTFSFETVRLVEDGSWLVATANVVASVAAGLAACTLGWFLVAQL